METSALTFAQPAWFLGLMLVAVFAGLYVWSQRRSDALIVKIVAPRLRNELAGAVSIGRRVLRATLVLLALAFIVVALARPQKGYNKEEIKQRGRDVILAIDTSRSMLATDVTPTRLARAKLVAQDLMGFLQGDRVGLIAFAGNAFLQAPLTLDQSAVLASLDELDTNIIPKGGTDIAAAIKQAMEAFGKGEGQTHALIILTDGEELDADGLAAAKEAGQQGIRIFTVGIGSAEGSLIPINTEGGGTDFVRDSSGKPVQSRLDETRLKEIAEATGGFYQPLGPDTARTIFEKGILPIEAQESGNMTSRLPIERYQWPLGAAIGLLIVWMILGERRRSPRLSRVALSLLLLLGGVNSSRAQTGMQEYESGNYDKALADFSHQLKTTPDSEKLQYNAGAAAYKTGNYGEAIDYFTKAIVTEDKKLREDATYDLANSLVRRGEGAKSNDEKKSDWKNAIQHYTETLNLDPQNKNASENRDIVKKLLADLDKQEKQQQDKKDQDKKDDKQKQDQKQDQKNDQKNQGQQNQQDQKNQDQKNQQQQDQQKQQGGGDQDQKDQQNKDQQNKDQQNKDQQNKDQQNKDQQGQSGQDQKQDQNKSGNGQPTPTPSPSGQNGSQSPQQDKGDQQQNQSQGGGNQGPQPTPSPGENGQSGEQQQPTPQPTPGEKKQGELKGADDSDKKDGPTQGGQAAGAPGSEQNKDGMTAVQARSLLNSLRSEEERVKLMQRQETEDTVKDW